MNKELEEAIKTVRKFNQENRYRDCGKINNSIDMVLQALESYQIKELQFLNNKLDNISATELQTILQPYYIQQESLKHKDEIINELKNVLENSIPKEVVKEKIEYIEDYFERLNGPDEDIEYIREKKQELLEGK